MKRPVELSGKAVPSVTSCITLALSPGNQTASRWDISRVPWQGSLSSPSSAVRHKHLGGLRAHLDGKA